MYKYDWPHKDAPDLAVEIWKHLVKSGVKAKRVERGVDHGVWVPFKLMFPPEKPLDIPVIQVSTYHGYDLESQIRLGEIFESLRYVIRGKCFVSTLADQSVTRHEGYLVVGSGMAVHSFPSIGEIQRAKTDEEREAVRAKVLAESRAFDTHLRSAVQKQDPVARRKALLELESLPEFKRSHPTVEVSSNPKSHQHAYYQHDLIMGILAFHSAPRSGWRSRECKGGGLGSRCR